MKKTIAIIYVVIGIGAVWNVLIAGPRAFDLGWRAVAVGLAGGGVAVWCGFAALRKLRVEATKPSQPR